MTPKILVSIFHKPGVYDSNVEQLKVLFKRFDIYMPAVEYYGNKWRECRNYFLENNYDSLFVICSDVSLVCGDIVAKISDFARDSNVGVYGFGTIFKYTFPWLAYNNVESQCVVPFIEGYCFGVNRQLIERLRADTVYGYGIDVEMGYTAHKMGLDCVVNNEVCIKHEFGKEYSDSAATDEYINFLRYNPGVYNFLRSQNIYTPL